MLLNFPKNWFIKLKMLPQKEDSVISYHLKLELKIWNGFLKAGCLIWNTSSQKKVSKSEMPL